MGIIVLAGVIITFLTSVVGFFTARRKVDLVSAKVQEVHVLVNQQLTDVVNRVGQLTGTLERAGVDVPDKPPGSTAPGHPAAGDERLYPGPPVPRRPAGDQVQGEAGQPE